MQYENLRIASGVTASLSVALQTIKGLRTKNSRDVSHGLIVLAYASASLGLAYGYYLHKPAIWGSNTSLLINLALLHGVKLWNDTRPNETLPK